MSKAIVAVVLILCGTILIGGACIHDVLWAELAIEAVRAHTSAGLIRLPLSRHLGTVCAVMGIAMLVTGAVYGLSIRAAKPERP